MLDSLRIDVSTTVSSDVPSERYPSYRAAKAHATAFVLAAVLAGGISAAEPGQAASATTPEAITENGAASTTSQTEDPTPQPDAPPRTPEKDPPPTLSIEQARGPDVTLIAGEERTVYEYRQNGKLTMIKVVPHGGKAYYLVPRDPTRGFGDLEQADTLVPRWVLIEF